LRVERKIKVETVSVRAVLHVERKDRRARKLFKAGGGLRRVRLSILEGWVVEVAGVVGKRGSAGRLLVGK